MEAVFFTKDRPMQFRAMLESFLYHINNYSINIHVIINYREEYKDIVDEFHAIDFIQENNLGFGQTLFDVMSSIRNELVIFGVDDQIITGRMNLNEAESVLNSNLRVLNYSFRSGTNIKGVRDVGSVARGASRYYYWKGKDWNWGYPFSLDSHVYRAWDITKYLNTDFRVPADFEATLYPIMLGSAREMAAFHDGPCVAYCQDLNKVQIEHGAPFYGDPVLHSPEYLIEQYMQGTRLDWLSAEGYNGDNPFCKDAIWRVHNNTGRVRDYAG